MPLISKHHFPVHTVTPQLGITAPVTAREGKCGDRHERPGDTQIGKQYEGQAEMGKARETSRQAGRGEINSTLPYKIHPEPDIPCFFPQDMEVQPGPPPNPGDSEELRG